MPRIFKEGERYEMMCLRSTYKKEFYSQKLNKTVHIFVIGMKDGDGEEYTFETHADTSNGSGFILNEINKFYVSYTGNFGRVEIKPMIGGQLPADIPPRNASKQSPSLISDYLVTAAFRSATDVVIAQLPTMKEEGRLAIPIDSIEHLGNQILDAMINARKRVNNE